MAVLRTAALTVVRFAVVLLAMALLADVVTAEEALHSQEPPRLLRPGILSSGRLGIGRSRTADGLRTSPADAMLPLEPPATEFPSRLVDLPERTSFPEEVTVRDAVELNDAGPWESLDAQTYFPTDIALDTPIDPAWQLALFYGYDAWRGIPDGAWTNNGAHAGANLGTRLGRFSDWSGIGLQIGGSVGVYDWGGTDYRQANLDEPTTQGFVTYGFYRRPSAATGYSFGLVQDWMLNHNYSVMAEDSTLYQWRFHMGYAMSDWTELGIWATWRGDGDTREVPTFGPVTWQPIEQANFFWHRKWGYGQADTWVWFGIPENDRLAGGGSLGDWIAGARSDCALSDRVSLYTMINYMHQSSQPGPEAAKEESWNFYMGIAFYPGRRARSATVVGQRWAPLMPLANNGLFLVDASQTY